MSKTTLTHLCLKFIGDTPQSAAKFDADYHADVGADGECVMQIAVSEDPPPYLTMLDGNCFVGQQSIPMSFVGSWVHPRILDETEIGMVVQKAPDTGIITA